MGLWSDFSFKKNRTPSVKRLDLSWPSQSPGLVYLGAYTRAPAEPVITHQQLIWVWLTFSFDTHSALTEQALHQPWQCWVLRNLHTEQGWGIIKTDYDESFLRLSFAAQSLCQFVLPEEHMQQIRVTYSCDLFFVPSSGPEPWKEATALSRPDQRLSIEWLDPSQSSLPIRTDTEPCIAALVLGLLLVRSLDPVRAVVGQMGSCEPHCCAV